MIIFWLVGLMKVLKIWPCLSPLKADFQTLTFWFEKLIYIEKPIYITMAQTHTVGGLCFKSNPDIAAVLKG